MRRLSILDDDHLDAARFQGLNHGFELARGRSLLLGRRLVHVLHERIGLGR